MPVKDPAMRVLVLAAALCVCASGDYDAERTAGPEARYP